jgi:hypothetical protein
MECEFEEKQFEQNLNFELASKKSLVYVPGQVLEKRLGFDAAVFSTDPIFWDYFPFRNWSRSFGSGVKLDKRWWNGLAREINLFPQFKCNLFLQHKRPAHLTTAHSKEWSHWKRSYYRFQITPHQQQALEKLEGKIQNAGVVVYASPAFSDRGTLWEAIKEERLIEKTNFVQAIKLKDHDAYTYVEPGNRGRAYSEPEDVESFDLMTTLGRLSEGRNTNDSNSTFIIETAGVVNEVMGEDSLRTNYREIIAYLSEGLDSPLAVAIIQMDVFCFLKQTTWMVAT